MPSSPAVLAAAKKAKSVKFSSYAAATSAPKASTSAVAGRDVEATNEKEGEEAYSGAEAGDDVDEEAGAEWKQPSGPEEIEDDQDDVVTIDPTSLLPPSTTLGSQTASSEQGLLSFPALSAKEAQGRIETQSRKVSVRGQSFRCHCFSCSLQMSC